MAIGGRAFSQMVEGEKLYDIVLRLPLELRDDPSVIGRIPVDAPAAPTASPASRIPLSQLAQIDPAQAGCVVHLPREQPPLHPDQVQRPRPRPGLGDRRGAAARSTTRRRARSCPQGYRIEWSGEFAQMQEANARLMWIVPLSIGADHGPALHGVQLAEGRAAGHGQRASTATMGGVWALWLTGTPFSISAAVGFISIFGVAVQNGVLLISYFNQMRDQGYPVREAVMRGAELRVRPVVMTSLTAALGLLPAALATSIGSQAQKPLAIVVVGGMLVTLFLTRYLMPVLYSFFPGPVHEEGEIEELAEGSHYTDEFLPALLGRPAESPTAPPGHSRRGGRSEVGHRTRGDCNLVAATAASPPHAARSAGSDSESRCWRRISRARASRRAASSGRSRFRSSTAKSSRVSTSPGSAWQRVSSRGWPGRGGRAARRGGIRPGRSRRGPASSSTAQPRGDRRRRPSQG